MKFVSIDIETTGLDFSINSILSIGIILEDSKNFKSLNELPSLHIYIKPEENLVWNEKAFEMNQNLFEEIRNCENFKIPNGIEYLEKFEISKKIYDFLKENGYNNKKDCEYIEIIVAGKNFGVFDKLFLEILPDWNKFIKIDHRIIDPSILFIDWKSDRVVPSLQKCLDKCKIETKVSHNALLDALDIIKVLRTFYF